MRASGRSHVQATTPTGFRAAKSRGAVRNPTRTRRSRLDVERCKPLVSTLRTKERSARTLARMRVLPQSADEGSGRPAPCAVRWRGGDPAAAGDGDAPSAPPALRAGATRSCSWCWPALVVLAGLGWVAARQIRSPSQIAADAAPPPAAADHRAGRAPHALHEGDRPRHRALRRAPHGRARDVAARAGQRHRDHARRAARDAGSRASVGLSVDGRPVFVLPGAVAMHRDLRPGSRGPDVAAARGRARRPRASRRAPSTGASTRATQAAVAALLRRRGYEPFGPTDTQLEQLRAAQADAAAARDAAPPGPQHRRRRRAAAPRRATSSRRGSTSTTARDAARHRAARRAGGARAARDGAQAAAAAARRRVGDARRRRPRGASRPRPTPTSPLKQEARRARPSRRSGSPSLDRNAVPLDAPPNERERAAAAVGTRPARRIRARPGGARRPRSRRPTPPRVRARQRRAGARRGRQPGPRRPPRRAPSCGAPSAASCVARRQLRLPAAARAGAHPARRTRGTLQADRGGGGGRGAPHAGGRRRPRAPRRHPGARRRGRVPARPARSASTRSGRCAAATLSGPVMTVTSSRPDRRLLARRGRRQARRGRATASSSTSRTSASATRGRVAEIDTHARHPPGRSRAASTSRCVPRDACARRWSARPCRLTIAVTQHARRRSSPSRSARVSVGGDGSSRVQVRARRPHRARPRRARASRPRATSRCGRPRGERLRRGDLVVVGGQRRPAAGAGP